MRYVKEKCRFPERFLLQSRIEYALVAKSKFCETAFRKNERISESIVLHTFTYCKNSCSSHGGEPEVKFHTFCLLRMSQGCDLLPRIQSYHGLEATSMRILFVIWTPCQSGKS